MTMTPRIGMTRAVEGQAGGEITFNQALNAIDTLANMRIIDRDLDTPPGSPSDGDVYIVAPTGTGAWAGHDDEIAYYFSGWFFVTPYEGMRAWIMDEEIFAVYDGADWNDLAGSVSQLEAGWNPPASGEYTQGLYGSTTFTTSTSTGIGTDLLCAFPIIVPKAFTAVAIALYCDTSASSSMRLGIYNDNGSNRPGTLIQGSSSITLSSTALQEYTLSPSVSLSPGIYWLSAFFASSSTKVQRAISSSSSFPLIGVLNNSGVLQNLHMVRRVVSYGAMPDPFGTPSALSTADVNPPCIFLKA